MFEKNLKNTEAPLHFEQRKSQKISKSVGIFGAYFTFKVSARNSFNFVKNKKEGEIVP